MFKQDPKWLEMFYTKWECQSSFTWKYMSIHGNKLANAYICDHFREGPKILHNVSPVFEQSTQGIFCVSLNLSTHVYGGHRSVNDNNKLSLACISCNVNFN